MDYYVIATLYGLGAIAQGLLSLRYHIVENGFPLTVMALFMIVGSLFFIPAYITHDYEPINLYIGMFDFFMMIYGFIFSRLILPIINEQSLLIFNVVFLFNFFEFFLAGHPTHYFAIAIFYIMLVPSIMVLTNGLVMAVPSSRIKMFFYIWFLVMSTLLLSIILYHNGMISAIHDSATHFTYMNAFTVICVGMIAMNMWINICPILALLPVTITDYQTVKERHAEIALHIAMLNSKYADDSLKPSQTWLVLLVSFGMLFFNYYYIHLNQFIVITIALQIMNLTMGGFQYRRK